MGTNCAPLVSVSDLFLFCSETSFCLFLTIIKLMFVAVVLGYNQY